MKYHGYSINKEKGERDIYFSFDTVRNIICEIHSATDNIKLKCNVPLIDENVTADRLELSKKVVHFEGSQVYIPK